MVNALQAATWNMMLKYYPLQREGFGFWGDSERDESIVKYRIVFYNPFTEGGFLWQSRRKI